MSAARPGLIEPLLRKLNPRFPTLFLVFLGLTIADFFVPDPIPFADEIALALLTAMLALWKDRKKPPTIPAQVIPNR